MCPKAQRSCFASKDTHMGRGERPGILVGHFVCTGRIVGAILGRVRLLYRAGWLAM